MTSHLRHAATIMATQARISALGELQYRANFWAWAGNQLALVAVTLASFQIVFGHVHSVNGWTQPELVAVLGSYLLLGAFINGVLHRSMSTLAEEVREGTFDYRLLKPFDAQLLSVTREVYVWSLLDAPLGLGLLAWGVAHAPHAPHGFALVGAALVAAGLLVVSCLLATGFWMLLSSLVFWTIQGEGILWALDDLYEDVRWPVSIFGPGLQAALTFVFPMGVAITAPPTILLGRFDGTLVVELLGMTALLLVLSRLAWNRAIARYASASS